MPADTRPRVATGAVAATIPERKRIVIIGVALPASRLRALRNADPEIVLVDRATTHL
jgi:hypothetical protein